MSTTPQQAAAQIAQGIIDEITIPPAADTSEFLAFTVIAFKQAVRQAAQEAIAWRPEVSEDVKERAKQYALSQYPKTEVKGIHTLWMAEDKSQRRDVCELIYLAASADSAKRIAELEAEVKELIRYKFRVWAAISGWRWDSDLTMFIHPATNPAPCKNEDDLYDLFRKETGRVITQ